MLSTAKLRYLRITPRKVRLVADLIRGEKLEEAQLTLSFTRKKAALPILKLLNQAFSNASEKNSKLDKENVYISKIFVDEGPSFKRTYPRSKGKADVILKRSSHVTIILDEIDKKAKKTSKVPKKKVKAIKEEKEIRKPAEKEVVKTEKEERMKERFRERAREEKVRPKRGRGFRRFFRRKAI